MQFTVRNDRTEDFETLWKLDQACFAPGISYSRGELKAYMRRAGAFTLVAEGAEGGSQRDATSNRVEIQSPTDHRTENQTWILGFLVAQCRRGIGHVITIDVRSEARRHRVGSALLDEAESRLGSAQCRMVGLETAVDNLAAISFYKRRGYNVMRTIPRYYSSGVDALSMEKDLLLEVAPKSIR